MKKNICIIVGTFSVLFLIPIWTVSYLPLQDWPIFMGYSWIGAHLSQFPSFQMKTIPPPYASGFFLLAGLMKIFPPLIAGKMLLSIYVVAFLAGFGYFLYRLNPRGLFLFFFAPLLVFNYFFAKGNISFILSIPLFLFAVPFFIRNSEVKWHTILVSFILALLIYFSHFFTYLAFLLLVLVFVIIRKKGLTAFLVSIIPAFLFIPYFIVNRAPVELEIYRNVLIKFISFRDTFGTWHPYFDVAMLTIPFLALFGFVLKGWRETERVWKIALVVLIVLFLLSPMEIYTLARADQRFLPFMFFVLLLFPKDKGLAKLPQVFASFLVLFSLINLTVKQVTFIRLQSEIQRCISVLNEVPENKAVVNIGTKDYYVGIINPFLHILGYLIVLDGNANIPTYEWNVPIRSIESFPKEKVDNFTIKNLGNLHARYDYFFIMEDGILFEKQLEEYAELIASDDEIKLFRKK